MAGYRHWEIQTDFPVCRCEQRADVACRTLAHRAHKKNKQCRCKTDRQTDRIDDSITSLLFQISNGEEQVIDEHAVVYITSFHKHQSVMIFTSSICAAQIMP
jgi:hypothetical protein